MLLFKKVLKWAGVQVVSLFLYFIFLGILFWFFVSLNFGIFGEGHPSGGVGLAFFTLFIGLFGVPVFHLLMLAAKYFDNTSTKRQVFAVIFSCAMWAILVWMFTYIFGIGGVYAALLYVALIFINFHMEKFFKIHISGLWSPEFFKSWLRITILMITTTLVSWAVLSFFDVKYGLQGM